MVTLKYVPVVFKAVSPEMEIIFPRQVHSNIQEFGVCYVKAWPRLTAHVYTNDDHSCPIALRHLAIIDKYTTAEFFTLDHINSSCLHIFCLTQVKSTDITISKCSL